MTYNGWTNWETWTASMIFYDSDYLFHRGREDAEDGGDMDLRQFEEYLETDFFDNYDMYVSEIEGTGFYNLYETYTRSALEEIDFRDLANTHFDIYQDGRKSYLKEIEEEEEEEEEEEPEEIPEEVEPEQEPKKVLLDGEFWVRAELSTGKWGEVELKGEQIEEYTTRETNETETDFINRREAIIKKAVKEEGESAS